MGVSGDLQRADFGDGFTWGVASASYQIEGAPAADGKGPSIWDTFSHRRGKIADGSDGDVACDFYNQYPGDLDTTRALGFDATRLSVSWPRVLPEGTGAVNRAGLDFYSRVVDACLERGLEPWLTLYHWDLPQALQDRGGWTSRDVLGWFGEYCEVVADALGDRVKHWMVFNEPLSFTVVGHLLGVHAPGVRSLRRFLAAVHHVNLAQAVGARVLRERVAGARVGTTQYLAPVYATGSTWLHERARRSGDAFVNRMFVEPNLGLGYPEQDCPLLRGIRRHQRDGDDEAVRVDWDFLGAQYYTRLKTPPLPIPGLWTAPIFGRDWRNFEVTSTGWEVRPDGLFDVLARVHDYGRFPSIVVTENGAAFPDAVVGGHCHDPRRVEFYRAHLAQVRRAVRAGIPVDGYFCWTLTDNFEWAEGFRARFGLVHLDPATQARTVKSSGRWFAALLGGAVSAEPGNEDV